VEGRGEDPPPRNGREYKRARYVQSLPLRPSCAACSDRRLHTLPCRGVSARTLVTDDQGSSAFARVSRDATASRARARRSPSWRNESGNLVATAQAHSLFPWRRRNHERARARKSGLRLLRRRQRDVCGRDRARATIVADLTDAERRKTGTRGSTLPLRRRARLATSAQAVREPNAARPWREQRHLQRWEDDGGRVRRAP
jgi:hypothetical protein